MWAKTSRFGIVGLVGVLLLVGCGGSHPATSSDPTLSTFTAKEIAAFNEGCKNLGLGGSLGDAPVCECALKEVEAQTNRLSFALDVVAWKDNSESGPGNENIPKEAVSNCVTKQQHGEIPEPDGLPTSGSNGTGTPPSVETHESGSVEEHSESHVEGHSEPSPPSEDEHASESVAPPSENNPPPNAEGEH